MEFWCGGSFSVVAAVVILATSPSSAVFKGAPVGLDDYRNVPSASRCTGTMLGWRSLLTAEHCFPGPQSKLLVGHRRWLNDPLGIEATLEWSDPQADVAVACLVKAADIGKPAELVADALPAEVTIVGYGYAQAPGGPPAKLARFALDPHIEFDVLIPSDALRVGQSSVSIVNGNFQATAAPSVPCQGDSGGPAFRIGTNEVVGVVREPAHGMYCGQDETITRITGDLKAKIDAAVDACEASTPSK